MRDWIWCDFNDRLDCVTYGLRVREALAALKALGARAAEGLPAVFYQEDGFRGRIAGVDRC